MRNEQVLIKEKSDSIVMWGTYFLRYLRSAHFSEMGNDRSLPDVSSVVVSGFDVVKSMQDTVEMTIKYTNKLQNNRII